MRDRLALVFAAALLFYIPRAVDANPLTYEFSGTLDQPFDGSQTFSGTLNLNENFGVILSGSGPVEYGVYDSLTLNFGGQTFTLENDPHNPSTTLTALPGQLTGEFSPGAPVVKTDVYGTSNGVFFDVSFFNPDKAQFTSLPDINLQQVLLPGNNSDSLYIWTGGSPSGKPIGGQITSIQVISTPEPSALSVFAGLGIVAWVCHSFRRSRLQTEKTP